MMLDELIHRVDPTRFAVSFACLQEGPWPESLAAEGYRVHVIPQTRSRDLRNAWHVSGELAAIVRREKVDLVHASYSQTLLRASLGARRARVPSVWVVFDPLVGYERRRTVAARRHLNANLLRLLRPDAIIYGTARAAGGVPHHRSTSTVTILPGIDPTRHGGGDGGRARRRLGIAEDAAVLAMFGRLTFLKSQTDFLRAMPTVLRSHPEARGVICGGEGEGDYSTRVEALRAELGLEDEVLLTGFVPDEEKDDILAAADVVVHLAKRESFGLTVIEAQAAGKAIVAADASGPHSLIDDGVTGMLVPIGDVDALTTVLLELLDDPARRADLGEAGRAAAMRYSVDEMVRRIEDVWDATLGRAARRPDADPSTSARASG